MTDLTSLIAKLEQSESGSRESYRPSNGTEGAFFIDRWCGRCKRDEAFRNDEGDSCPIVAMTFAVNTNHPDYPKEWIYDGQGRPTCTAFDDMEKPPRRDEIAAVGDLFGDPSLKARSRAEGQI